MTIHTDRLTGPLDRGVVRGADALAETPVDDAVLDAVARRVLDNGRRRAVVRCLLETGEPIELRRLVARIADDEHDAAALSSLHDCRQRIYVSLRRTHLPLLDRHRVLTYDPDEGVVAPCRRLSALESLFEVGRSETD